MVVNEKLVGPTVINNFELDIMSDILMLNENCRNLAVLLNYLCLTAYYIKYQPI